MNHGFLIKNTSKLPTNLIFLTNNLLFRALFSHKNIGEIILNLNSVKTQIFGTTINRSLELIFKEASGTSLFPSEWVKVTLILSMKKLTSKC